MAIIGIIMVIVTSLISTSLRSFNRQNDRLNAVNVGDMVISTIKTQIEKVGHVKLNKYFIEESIKDSEQNIIGYKDQTGDSVADKNICNIDRNQFPVCLHDLQNYTTIFLMPSTPTTTNEQRRALTGAARRGKLYKIKKDVNAKTPIITIDTEAGYGIPGYTVDGYNRQIYIEPLLDESLYHGYEVDVRFEYIKAPQTSDSGSADGTNNATGKSASVGIRNVGTDTTTPDANADNTPGGTEGGSGDGTTGGTEGGSGDSSTGGTEGDGTTGGTEGGESEGDGTLAPVLPDIQPDVGPGGRLNCIKVIVDVYNGIKKVHTVSGTITFVQKFFSMDTPYEGFDGQFDMILVRS